MVKAFQRFGLLLATILSAVSIVFAALNSQWALAALAAGATCGWIAIQVLLVSLRNQAVKIDRRLRAEAQAKKDKEDAKDEVEAEELTLRTLEELQLIRAHIASIARS